MHSSGLMSVPVAIISTVTAIRGLTEFLKLFMRSSGFAPVVLYVIFWQNSFPSPNTSRVILVISSACASSFANISVFGTCLLMDTVGCIFEASIDFIGVTTVLLLALTSWLLYCNSSSGVDLIWASHKP